MSTGSILLTIFNGRRKELNGDTPLLVRAIDGRHEHKRLVRLEKDRSQYQFTDLKFHNNFVDNYTILVSAKHHADAGFAPVRISADKTKKLNVMMLRREAEFEFEAFAEIQKREALHALLCGKDASQARAFYEGMAANKDPALACLLNIATAVEQMSLISGSEMTPPIPDLDRNGLKSFRALELVKQDRAFVRVDARFLKQIEATAAQNGKNAFSRFVKAPAGLHPGATVSYKQIEFGEANVQMSFHENDIEDVNGLPCMLVDVDIDYFKDSGAHFLLEVVANKLKKLTHGKNSSEALTDPRTVYGLRWTAGQHLDREFNPPYTLN